MNKLKHKCIICDKIFRVRPNGKIRTCSHECSVKWYDYSTVRIHINIRNKRQIKILFTGELRNYVLPLIN